MRKSEVATRELLCTIAGSLFARGLTAGSTGNLSVRLDDGWLVTPTGTSLGRLDPGQLTRLDSRQVVVSGDPATKEKQLHLAVYEARPETRAIVHLHAHWSVAVSMLPHESLDSVVPPLTPYHVMKVGKVALVPYLAPGHPALAERVGALARTHRAILLARHGPVVAGDSITAAADAIEELEASARLRMTVLGHDVEPLTEENVAELRLRHGAQW